MSLQIDALGVAVHLLRPRDDGFEVLLMRRADTLAGVWMGCAGRLEADETAWEAALREAREETGLVPERLYNGSELEMFYSLPADKVVVLPVFVGFCAEGAEVVLNEEHDDFAWLSFEEAIERVEFGGQRRILEHVCREFVERAPSPRLLVDPERAEKGRQVPRAGD